MINVVVTGIMARAARETLPTEQRKSINFIDCTPLSFVKILRTGSVNLRLLFVLLMQSFGELRINQDVNMLNLKDNLSAPCRPARSARQHPRRSSL